MAVPKRKTSRMKRRQRKAANRYEGVQATFCTNCSAPSTPHRADCEDPGLPVLRLLQRQAGPERRSVSLTRKAGAFQRDEDCG